MQKIKLREEKRHRTVIFSIFNIGLATVRFVLQKAAPAPYNHPVMTSKGKQREFIIIVVMGIRFAKIINVADNINKK